MNKKDKQKLYNNFLTFLKNKKAMEMWQLVLIILALILLLFVIAWFGGLSGELGGLFEKLKGLL